MAQRGPSSFRPSSRSVLFTVAWHTLVAGAILVVPSFLVFREPFFAPLGINSTLIGAAGTAVEFHADNANTVVSSGYHLTNLRVGFDASLGSTTVSPFLGVNNVFGETYNSNLRVNAFGGRYFEPGPDRNVYTGIGFRYDFR